MKILVLACVIAVLPMIYGDDIVTYGGTANGAVCVFPFVYQGRIFRECTTVDHNRPWCYTTSDNRRARKWGNCLGEFGIATYGGNANGAVCVFPFTYQGRIFATCTRANHDRPWCATTSDYRRDKKWGNCPGNDIDTYGGTANGAVCVFPFTYQGRIFTECTTVDHNRPWCYTTSDTRRDRKWGNCPGRTSIHTTGGNANGAQCVFPFSFRSRLFYNCTLVDNSVHWCATTSNYERDEIWGNCLNWT